MLLKVTVYLQGWLKFNGCSASRLHHRYPKPHIKLKHIDLDIQMLILIVTLDSSKMISLQDFPCIPVTMLFACPWSETGIFCCSQIVRAPNNKVHWTDWNGKILCLYSWHWSVIVFCIELYLFIPFVWVFFLSPFLFFSDLLTYSTSTWIYSFPQNLGLF